MLAIGLWALVNGWIAYKTGFPALTLAPTTTPTSRRARRFARAIAYKEGM